MNQLVEVEAFFELTDDAVDVARFIFGGSWDVHKSNIVL